MARWLVRNIRLVLVGICLLLLTFAAFLDGWRQMLFLFLAMAAGGFSIYFLMAGGGPLRKTLSVEGPEALEGREDAALEQGEEEDDYLPDDEDEQY